MELTTGELRTLLDLYTQGMRIQHERNMSALQERLDAVTAERDALQAEITVPQTVETGQEDAVPADGAWFTTEELANVLQAAHEAKVGHGEGWRRSALRAIEQQRESGPQLIDEAGRQVAKQFAMRMELNAAREVIEQLRDELDSARQAATVYFYVSTLPDGRRRLTLTRTRPEMLGEDIEYVTLRPESMEASVLFDASNAAEHQDAVTVYMHYRWLPLSKSWAVVLSTSSERPGPKLVHQPTPWSVAEWITGEEPLEVVLHVDGAAEVIEY